MGAVVRPGHPAPTTLHDTAVPASKVHAWQRADTFCEQMTAPAMSKCRNRPCEDAGTGHEQMPVMSRCFLHIPNQ